MISGTTVPRTGCAVILAFAATAAAWANDWHCGFEKGLAGARSYHGPPHEAELQIHCNGAAEGRQFLRCALPGEKSLEGISLSAAGLPGGRLAMVTARVRGRGRIWLCLHSRNGWLYSPSTLNLNDQWQDVSLGKMLLRTDTSLGIHFLSRSVQKDALFEVDDIRVRLAEPPQLDPAEVAPWRFEAEDFASQPACIAADQAASAAQVARTNSHAMTLSGLPFPRTSKPVTVYLHVRPGSETEQYWLETTQGGNPQTVRTVQPIRANQWQWLAFPPATADEIGDCFRISAWRAKDTVGVMAFDDIALTTREDLKPDELAAAPLWGARRPLTLVAQAAAPPAIDGQADDPCWRNTVACTGFLGLGSRNPAEAETTARLCYDQNHLYLLFLCREPILNVAQQRRSEFVAGITKKDGEVWQDDSIVVLLDPARTGEQVFDFTVNALGTIADARSSSKPDLWHTRDLNFNSAARAQGCIGEDVWTVELAVPFADLGGPPKPGDAWQAGLGRIARARAEVTSWNPCRKGLHDPDPLGTLVFGGPAPGVTLAIPAALEPGKNRWTASLAPQAGQAVSLYLYSSAGAPPNGQRSRTCTFAELDDQPREVSQTFVVDRQESLEVEYGVYRAATLDPLCMTPTLPRPVKSSTAQVRLSCDGPYELLLNDELISRGARRQGEAISVALRNGANVLALKLKQGTAAIAVEAAGGRWTAETWKVAPADTENATRAALDDRAWPMAVKLGDHPQLGSIVGEPQKTIVLRRTILSEKTRVWPKPEPAFHLARGATQHFTIIADGLPGKRLDDWTTYIATPPEFEIVGASGFYGSAADQPRFSCTQLGTRQLDQREMCVVKVVADKPVRSGRHYVMSLFQVFARCREQTPEPQAASERFVYWSEANGGNVSEPPQSFPVRLLPKLAGRQPKTLVFQLWGGWFANLDDLAMREEILQCAQAAGLNDLVAGDRWTSENAPKYGLQPTLTTNFEPWGLNLASYLNEHPDQRLITSRGEPAVQGPERQLDLMCTSLLLGVGWPGVEEVLKQRLDQIRPRTVDIDFEYGPFSGPHSCYCPRCLAAFREHARLAGDVTLNAEIIREKHADEWIDFMARRVAQVFAKFKQAIHRLSPETRFSIYSGYQTLDNPERYGVDWRYIGELRACDRAGAGYGEREADIARTVESLQGIPLLCGLLVVPYDTNVTTPLNPLTKAEVLRMLLAGTGGVLVYNRMSLDGRTWHAVAEISRLAASAEDVFLHGKPAAPLPGFDVNQVQQLRSGQTTLVCAINPTGEPVEHAIQLPAEAGSGHEFFSGAKVAAGERVVCALEPGDAAVYILGEANRPLPQDRRKQ